MLPKVICILGMLYTNARRANCASSLFFLFHFVCCWLFLILLVNISREGYRVEGPFLKADLHLRELIPPFARVCR